MSEASQKTEVGAWGATLSIVKRKVKGAKEKLAEIGQEYERKKRAEEEKIQEALMVGRQRLDRINTELEAKEKLIPEAAKRGLTLEQYLKIVKRIPDLDAGILQREKISGQWDKAVFGKQKRHDELDQRNKEKEEHWGELTTKLKFAEQLLQHNQVENQHWGEKISNQLTQLDQLSNQVRELMGTRTKLNIEVQEIEKKNRTLEEKNVDLKKTSDSLEERNAWLGESNTKLESMLNQHLLEIDKIKTAEIKREAQVDAEFNERKSKINRDIEKYTEGAVEKARKIVREKVEEMAHETHEEIARRNEFIETSRIRIISLATQLGDSEGKLKSEVAKAKGLEAEAKAKVEDLRGKLESLEGFKVKFVDGRELTLEQTRSEFISAYADEIKEKTEEKYQGLKSDYETKMPQLVYKRLVQILEKPLWPVEITDAIIDKAKTIADGILRNGEMWPSWFKEYYRKEVSTRLTELLDDKFNERVNGKSQEVAVGKLEILKTQAWPEWFSLNVKPAIDRGIFKALKGLWTGWTCDKCGTKFEFTLTEHNIGELLRNGEIEFPCPNANCVDYSLLGWRKLGHKIKIPLEILIARMTEKIEIALVPAKKVASVA